MLAFCLVSVCTLWLTVLVALGPRALGASVFGERGEAPQGDLRPLDAELTPGGRVALMLTLLGVVAFAAWLQTDEPRQVLAGGPAPGAAVPGSAVKGPASALAPAASPRP